MAHIKGLIVTMRLKIGIVVLPWVGAMALFASFQYGNYDTSFYLDSSFYIPLILIMIGSILGTTSGYAINDYFDSTLDSHKKSKRADKAVTMVEDTVKHDLIIYAAILGLPSLTIMFYLNIMTGVVALCQLLSILLYSAVFKQRTPFSNMFVVLPTALMPIAVFFIYTPTIPLEAILLFVVYFLYEPGFTWSGTCRDIEGDKEFGIPTLPLTYGIKNVAKIILICWSLLWIASISLFIWTELSYIYLVGSSFAALLLLRNAYTLLKQPLPHIGAITFFRSAKWFWIFSISIIVDIIVSLLL